MSAQIEFAMHPLDEAAFAEVLLADPAIRLVDGPRWPGPVPELRRGLDGLGDYVLVWPGEPVPPLGARHIATTGDWYCDSEASTLQLLRSRLDGATLISGRLALHDVPQGFPEAAGQRLQALFNKLRRHTKAGYRNGVVCWANPRFPFAPADKGRSANPSAPDTRLWVGPHALLWLQAAPGHVIRQFAGSAVEGQLAPETVT